MVELIGNIDWEVHEIAWNFHEIEFAPFVKSPYQRSISKHTNAKSHRVTLMVKLLAVIVT